MNSDFDQQIYEIVLKCFDRIAEQQIDTLHHAMTEVVTDHIKTFKQEAEQVALDTIKRIDREFFN